MKENIFQRLLGLRNRSNKQLNKGINLEDIYSEELARLSAEERKSFLEMSKDIFLFDFQFPGDKTISVPAYDAYPICSERFIRNVFETQELFDMFMNQVYQIQNSGEKASNTIGMARLQKSMSSAFFLRREYPVIFIRAAHMIYGKSMPRDVGKRLKKLESVLSIKKLLKTKVKNISTYVDGEAIVASKKELLNILFESHEKFENRFSDDKIDYNYKLFCALEIFLFQGKDYPELLETYAFLSEHVKRYERIFDEEIPEFKTRRMIRQTKTIYGDALSIHPKLRTEVFKDMPQDFSDLEKSIYVYEKLCQILVYDSKFFVDNTNTQILEHSNFMRLNTITPENNTVVCYEFSYIYAKFLEELGINHEIKFGIRSPNDIMNAKGEAEKVFYGGTMHASCVVKADNIVFVADSTTTAFGGDLVNAKVGKDLDGLTVISREHNKEAIFYQARKRVEARLREEQRNVSQSDLLKTYRGLLENDIDSNIELDEKIAFLERLLTSAEKSNGLENYYYLSGLIKILFKKNVSMEVVAKTVGRNTEALAIIESLDGQNGEYLTYSAEKGEFSRVTLEELQEAVRTGLLVSKKSTSLLDKILKKQNTPSIDNASSSMDK